MAFQCNSGNAVRKAVEASYRLPAATNDLIAQIETGRDNGIYTPDEARRFGVALNAMAKAEVIYVQSVKSLNAAYEATGKFDPAKIKDLKVYFDASIVGPFLQILEDARLISGAASTAIQLALSTVRIILTTIGRGFGSSHLKALAAAH